MKAENPGLILAFVAALSYCFLNIGVRFMVDAEITVWGIIILRGGAALLVAAGAAAILRRKLVNPKWKRLAAIGLCSFLSTICTTTAISLIPLYQALVLLYLYPAVTVPLGYFMNGDQVTPRDCLLVGAAFLGCLVLLWPDSAAGLTFGPGHVAGILTCLFYAMSFVLTRGLGSDSGGGLQPLFYYGLWTFFATAALIPLLNLQTGITLSTTFLPGLGLGGLAVLGLLTSYAALRWLAPFKVGIIGTLEVFGGAVASWLLFNDPVTPRTLVGGLIILAAALKLRRS